MVRAEILSLEAMGRFLSASEEVRFEAADRPQLYQWLEEVLVGQQYASLGKPARGLVRRYIAKITGLSRSQVTRLIALYTASGRVAELDRPAQYRRRGHRRHRRGQAHAASQGHAVRKAAAHRVEPVAKQEGPRRWRMKQQSLAMHQTRKGSQWFFRFKTHIGVDAKEGHVHSVATMAANVSD